GCKGLQSVSRSEVAKAVETRAGRALAFIDRASRKCLRPTPRKCRACAAVERAQKPTRAVTVPCARMPTSSASSSARLSEDVARRARRRVLIENVTPRIDGGRYPAKRTLGETVVVSADIFADGHDLITAVLRVRANGEARREIPMAPMVNERWETACPIEVLGSYAFTFEAWIDHVRSWRRDLEKKAAAGQDVAIDLATGAQLIRAQLKGAPAAELAMVETWLLTVTDPKATQAERVTRALDPAMAMLLQRFSNRGHATTLPRPLEVVADPELARFGAWYECFPR